MNSRWIPGLAAAAATVVFCGGLMAGEAQARHRGDRPCYERLDPQLQEKYDAIMRDFQERMMPVTEKLMAKQLELDALAGNAGADPKHISDLAGEIAALRTQIRQERMKLRDRLKEETGLADGFPRKGPGHLKRGMHFAYPDDARCSGSRREGDGERAHGRKHRFADDDREFYGRGYGPRHF